MNKITKILTVVVTCLCIGYFSEMISRESIEVWYPTLVKPSFSPPNFILTAIWSTLYVMMGVAAGLVWHHIESDRINVRKGLQFFAIQLGLNFLWMYLFFKLHNPLLALAEIFVLWLMIYETYIVFRKVDKIAGMLLLPYLVWVTYAGIVNAAIFWLNR